MNYRMMVMLLACACAVLLLPAQSVFADEPMTPSAVQAQLKTTLSRVLTAALPEKKVDITDTENELTLAVNTRRYLVYATDMTGEIADTLHEEIGPKADGLYLHFQMREARDVEQAVLPGTYQRPYWTSYVNVTPLADGKHECFYTISYGHRVKIELQRNLLGAILQLLPTDLPARLIRQRNELVAAVDTQLRQNLRDLAATFPQLKVTNNSTLEKELAGHSPVGSIMIEFGHEHGGKGGTNEQVAEKDSFLVRVFLVAYTGAQNGTERQMAFNTVYPFINLHGQVFTTAGDPALADALAKLVRTALLPLETLNAANSGPCAEKAVR